ncbi:hypothetical protein GCM10009692_09670 [Leucobacter aridicollis]
MKMSDHAKRAPEPLGGTGNVGRVSVELKSQSARAFVAHCAPSVSPVDLQRAYRWPRGVRIRAREGAKPEPREGVPSRGSRR